MTKLLIWKIKCQLHVIIYNWTKLVQVKNKSYQLVTFNIINFKNTIYIIIYTHRIIQSLRFFSTPNNVFRLKIVRREISWINEERESL